jgi:hypothetical protein
MITTKELSPFIKKVSILESEVNSLEIRSNEDMKKATVLLSNLNKYGDKVMEMKEKLTKPINESLKAIREMFKPVEVYKGMIETIRSRMSVWQTSEINRMRSEEAKIAARVGEGKGKLRIETAVKKMDAIDKVEKEVATDQGLVQFREVKKFRVPDISKLAIEYHMVDEKKIQDTMKNGIELIGVEYYTEQIPVNYR